VRTLPVKPELMKVPAIQAIAAHHVTPQQAGTVYLMAFDVGADGVAVYRRGIRALLIPWSLLARTCRSKLSDHGSLSSDKRTTYAQCEFFAFYPVRTLRL
jgi:hypothetical protein